MGSSNQKFLSVEELIDSIRNGSLNSAGQYDIEGKKVKISASEQECLLGKIDVRFNRIDTLKQLKKKCMVFKVQIFAVNNDIEDTRIIVIDKKNNTPYPYVKREDNGDYSTNGIGINEMVCYAISVGKGNEDFESQELETLILKEEDAIDLSSYFKTKYPIFNFIILKEILVEMKESQDPNFICEGAIFIFKNKALTGIEEALLRVLDITDSKGIKTKASYYLGRVYKQKGKTLLAEKYFDISLTNNSNNYDALLNKGEIYAEQGRYVDALTIFETCDGIKPNYNCSWHWIEKSKCLFNLGQTEEAIKTLDYCIEVYYMSYPAHDTKGSLLFAMGLYAEAEKEFDICEKIFPNNTYHKTYLGKIYFLTGREEKAIDIFNWCARNDFKENKKYVSSSKIGYFFHSLGNKELAYKYYENIPLFRRLCHMNKQMVKSNFGNRTYKPDLSQQDSIFNVSIYFQLLDKIVENIPPTETKELFDQYQIYWPGIGYICEENKRLGNYLTILTQPFTKSITLAYVDDLSSNIEPTSVLSISEVFKLIGNTSLGIQVYDDIDNSQDGQQLVLER